MSSDAENTFSSRPADSPKAESTFSSRGAASSDAKVSSEANTHGELSGGNQSDAPTTLQETFEQKYDDLGPEEFSKKVIEFGYWLEAHGRELSSAEKERTLAEYSFLQNRVIARLQYEYKSGQELGFIQSAAAFLFQGAANSGLVPAGHLPPSYLLAVAGSIAAIDTPSPSGGTPATKPVSEASVLLKPPGKISGSGGAADVGGKVGATNLPERAAEIHNVLDPIARGMRTTAVLQTDMGFIVAGGRRDLTPAQRNALSSGEIASRAPGVHAEITALGAAEKLRTKPQELAATRPICEKCAEAIAYSGGVLTSPKTAIWPRP